MVKLSFDCCRCRKRLTVPLRYVGKMVACPHCDAPNRVPRPGVPDPDTEPVDEGLGLPRRAAHAPYLAELEAAAKSKRPPADASADPITDRRTRRWLIAANVLAAIAVLAVIAYLVVPWSSLADWIRPPAELPIGNPPPPADPAGVSP